MKPKRTLRSMRVDRGLTLEELSARLDVDLSRLSRIERGEQKPTLAQTVELSLFYGTTVDDIVSLVLDAEKRYQNEARG